MPSIPCQGCGGHFPMLQLRQYGPDGERFCRHCYHRYKDLYDA